MPLINCFECKHQISDQAKSCPSCGAPVNASYKPPVIKKHGIIKKIFLVALLLVTAFVVLAIISGKPPAPAADAVKIPTAPIQNSLVQQDLERTRKDYSSGYSSALNEIQKSKIFNQANQATSDLIKNDGTAFVNWQGTIQSLKTSHGGKTVNLKISSNRNITYAIDDDAPANSKIYGDLSSLREGQKVYFSGKLVSSFGKWENSLTEVGSLSLPEFSVEFSYVGLLPENNK